MPGSWAGTAYAWHLANKLNEFKVNMAQVNSPETGQIKEMDVPSMYKTERLSYGSKKANWRLEGGYGPSPLTLAQTQSWL